MKKIKFVILFLFSVAVLSAANPVIKSYSITKWNIETWIANDYQKQVLSFQDAVYPNENSLPYFSTLISSTKSGEDKISLENEVFENLTTEEQNLIEQSGFDIPSSIELNLKDENQTVKFHNVLFLPIINVNGKYQKLVSFDLKVTTSSYAASKALKASSSTHSFATSSVLNSGNWVKIRVPSSGIYKLTYQQIQNAGIDPNDVHIYGYGGAMLNEDFSQTKKDDLPQVAFYKEKGADGIFNSGDYILFYGQGPISWKYDNGIGDFVHNANVYSNYGYYFLASGITSTPKSIETAPVVNLEGNEPAVITSFVDYALYEKDLKNLATSGREFYGEEFSQTYPSRNFSFSMPNVLTSSAAYVRFDGAIYSMSDNASRSSFKITIGSASSIAYASNIITSDYYAKATDVNKLMSFTASSQMNVNLTFTPIVSGAKAWLNYLSITVPRRLIMDGKVMFFRNPAFMTEQYGKFELSTTNGNIKIWDITDPETIKEIPTTYDSQNSILSFYVKNEDVNTIREFVAIDMTNSFAEPEIVGKVVNQNLHALSNPDFVIISNPDYIPQAQELAQAHQEKDNMSVVIVTPEQIYNEYSSGTPDASAYRWFLKMFYDRKNNGIDSKELKYLLLLGDGTYDNRQLIIPADNCNKILTYESYKSLKETESYVTDDYFGFLDDSEGTNPGGDLLDIGVGRIPVNTETQADDVVKKIIRYMNNENKGHWKNQLCYVADDGDGVTHINQADSIARKIGRMNPEYEITKLYLDAYKQQTTASGSQYPEVREKLLNQIKNGLLMLNYTGHGGVAGWADEKVITNKDIINMYNDNLALWVTATCDFSRFDSKELSAGENVLLNPDGGGIGLFTTTRTVYSGPNFNLNSKFSEYVFSRDVNGNRLRLGDIMKLTKRSLINDINKLNFSLLGDPALMLSYPAYEIITDSIKGQDATVDTVTIGALDKVTVKGHVVDNDGVLMDNFNGVLTITVFDKIENINTLANDASSNVYTYKDRSVIFSGRTEVINGEFSVTFMVPKDINYTYGFGKINYYAADDINDNEAHGYFDKFIIGGSTNDLINDNEGPEIDMYLNTSAFNSQDKVNESPLFIANVSDENGINIVGSGIGHDVVMILDNQDWIVLNDYYESDLGTYQSGTIKYKISGLAEGEHTLTFRVWDLLNNSSSDSFEFEVVNGLSVGIIDAYCYPNPASTITSFVLKHDRPDEEMNVVLKIYDLTGRELWTYDTDLYPSDDLLTITDWNLETSSGHKLQKGIYLFKVEVTTTSGKMSTKSKKIVIAG